MTDSRLARYRLLVLCQVALILSSLLAPLSGLAADPTDLSTPTTSEQPTAESTPEPTPEPKPDPTPDPTAEPTPEPTAAPTPEPTAQPTSDPSPDPTPDPTAEPSHEPAPTAEPSTAVDTDDYVVTFIPGTGAAERARILAAAGAEVVDTIAPLRIAVVRVAEDTSVVADLRAEPAVSRVELDRVRATEAGPDDRLYRRQWSLPKIGWDDVYDSVDPSGSAVVAVLDTGVDAEHADLAGKLVPGTSLLAGVDETDDANGHGTAMAGIIAATTDNRRDVAGIGFDGVKVMPVTVLDSDGLGQDSDIIEGIVWAVDRGADVINLSFSNPGFSAALQAAVDYAWARDVVVVAATGNDGSSAPTYPAGDRGVIGVSNTDRADRLHASSNHGADTFLAAPGTSIVTLAAGGGTTTVTGTSASSAEVAGAAALLRAIDPAASNGIIVGRLARSAAPVGMRSETGNGRLDLARAVDDHGTATVQPAGVPGAGGPFVGPYVAAAANVLATSTLNGSTGTINVATGSSITLVMNVTTTGGGTANDWNSSRWAFGTTAPAAGTMTCVDHGNHDGAATYSETFSINAPATAGNYNLYLYAYNGDACASGQGALFTRTLALDNLAPSATPDLQPASDSGSSNTDNVTNAANLTFALAFGETVTGLAAGDFSVLGTATGCVVGAPAGGPASYTVTLTGCSNGTVTLRLAANAVTDGGGNTNLQSDGPAVTVDRTVPTVTLIDLQNGSDTGTSTTDNITNATTLVFDLTFNEAVTGLAAGDFSEPGTATGCVFAPGGSGTTYTVTLTGCSAGTVIVRLAANAVADTAGNGNAVTDGPTITVDRTGPTVTINQAVGQVDPTGTSPITFTIVFNGPVTSFATGDVTVGGTSGGTKTGTVSGGPTTYSVAVTGMTTPGTVVATIATGVATDAAGNNNAASTSTDNTVTWDNVAPTASIDLNAASDSGVSNSDNTTNAASLVYTITFSETVTGVALADFNTTGSTATGCVIGSLSGSGATRSVTLTTCSNGNVVLNFVANGATDTAGNTGPASVASLAVTVDRTAPTVTINQAVSQVDPTGASPINYTVTFSEPVSGFITGDVTVGGTSGGAKTGTVSGGATTFNVAVTGMTTSGTVVASVAASRATDIAGNNNTVSTSADNTVTWDSVAPTETINQAVAQVDPTGTSPITFTVVFSEAMTGFATGDVTIGGTSGGLKTGTVSGGPTTYSVLVTGMTTPGTVVATIAAGVATDTAGNSNAASTSADNGVTWDNVVPTATIDLEAGSDSGSANTDNVTNAASLMFDVTFSEAVTGLTAGDFSNVGTATGCTVGAPSGSGSTYTVTLTGCSQGTVILRLAAGAVSDPAANINAQTDGPTITVDRTGPTVTIDQAVSQVDPTNVSPIDFNAVFSEPVAGFAGGDVSITGTSGGVKSAAVSGGPSTYGVAVTGMTISGTVVASVVGGVATDLAGNASSASTSTDNTVTWNRATHVGFVQQPTDTVYGTTINPAVTVAILDASDQVVTESGASVTLTLAPAGPTLGGTLTVAAVNGIATFGDLTVDGVGTYTLGASSFGLTGATSVAFDITPAPLTITADDLSKVYGQTATFAGSEFSTSGLLLSDTVTSVTLTSPGSAASATVAGSPYPITPSAAVGSGLGNYSITYVDGELTITAAPLTVTADDATKTYGDTLTFAGTEFATSGLVGSDSVTSVTLSSPGAAASATVAGGPYLISPSAAVGSGLGNYSITYVDGELTVTQADATIVVTGYSVTYDGLPHTSTGTATGVFGEDLSADLDLSGTTHTQGGTYSDPWTFTDTTGNYDDDADTVANEITPAPLTVTADDATKTYGDTLTFASTEFTTSGLVGSDTVSSVTLTSPGSAASATVAGSPYPITPSAAVGSGLGNYSITYVDRELTVTLAPLTVTADDQAKPSGATFVFTGTEFTTVGLRNADTVASATLTSGGAAAAAPPGDYPILISTAVGTGVGNYAITYVSGTLTVGNTSPVIGDADVTTPAMTVVSGSVSVSDPDAGQTVTLSISSAPAHGSVAVANDGSFAYTPSGTYTGLDTFTIEGCDDHSTPACATGTVTVAILPVAVDDEVDVESEGGAVEVDVQANDIGDAGEVTIVSGPDHGTAQVGSIIYTPTAGYAGTDQVVYRVCSPNDPALCDDGTLTITVTSTGDAPETDTTPSGDGPSGDITRGVLPPLMIVLLAIAAVLGGAAVTKRRRSPSR